MLQTTKLKIGTVDKNMNGGIQTDKQSGQSCTRAKRRRRANQ